MIRVSHGIAAALGACIAGAAFFFGPGVYRGMMALFYRAWPEMMVRQAMRVGSDIGRKTAREHGYAAMASRESRELARAIYPKPLAFHAYRAALREARRMHLLGCAKGAP